MYEIRNYIDIKETNIWGEGSILKLIYDFFQNSFWSVTLSKILVYSDNFKGNRYWYINQE